MILNLWYLAVTMLLIHWEFENVKDLIRATMGQSSPFPVSRSTERRADSGGWNITAECDVLRVNDKIDAETGKHIWIINAYCQKIQHDL
jgi:hypothetical protein